jgi:hypothetical protein
LHAQRQLFGSSASHPDRSFDHIGIRKIQIARSLLSVSTIDTRTQPPFIDCTLTVGFGVYVGTTHPALIISSWFLLIVPAKQFEERPAIDQNP